MIPKSISLKYEPALELFLNREILTPKAGVTVRVVGRAPVPAGRGRAPSSGLALFPLSQLASRNEQRFRGGLVLKAPRPVYHSTLGLRVYGQSRVVAPVPAGRARAPSSGQRESMLNS